MKYSCIEKLNIIKMLVFLKLIYEYKAFPVKIPASFFVHIDLKGPGPRIGKTILTKKNKVGVMTLFYLKDYCNSYSNYIR